MVRVRRAGVAALVLLCVASAVRSLRAECPEPSSVTPDVETLLLLASCYADNKDYARAKQLVNRIRSSGTVLARETAERVRAIEARLQRVADLLENPERPASAEDATQLLDDAASAYRGKETNRARALTRRAADAARTVEEARRVVELATFFNDPDARVYVHRFNSIVARLAVDLGADGRVVGFIGSGSSFAPSTFFNSKSALAYRVAPIVLAGVHARMGLADKDGWNLLRLKAGYETDRVYRSGGSLTPTSLTNQLGISGVAADIVSGAVAYVGIGIEGELARFTNGRVQLQDVASGMVLSDAPLVFTRTRLEATVNLTRYLSPSPSASSKPEEHRSRWTARALYYKLALPRIAYLTQKDAATQDDVVVAESEPQNIQVAFGAAGASYTWVIAAGDRGYVATDLTLLIGGGEVAFSMPANLGQAAGPTNRVQLHEPTIAAVTRVGLNGDVRLNSDEVAIFFGAAIGAEQYYANASVPGSTSGSVGFADAFYFANVHVTFRYASLR